MIVMVRSAIDKNKVSVRTDFMANPIPVEGDRVQLQQVVLNLVLNAVEAMSSVEGAARELSIETEQDQTGGVLVAVRDSGPGIEHFERVFDPFYTTKTSGLGMGLAICRSIIDAHGGRLWVDANEPRGAVFRFTLPAAQLELMNSLLETACHARRTRSDVRPPQLLGYRSSRPGRIRWRSTRHLSCRCKKTGSLFTGWL